MKQSENANDPTKKKEKTCLFGELDKSSDFGKGNMKEIPLLTATC